MPTSCCAYGCKNKHVKGGEIQFFSFPFKDPNRLAAWVTAVGRKGWKLTKNMRVCSEHFTSFDFLERPGTYINHIKENAVPSIFMELPKHLQLKEKVMQKECSHCEEIKFECEPSCSIEPPNIIEKMEPVHINEQTDPVNINEPTEPVNINEPTKSWMLLPEEGTRMEVEDNSFTSEEDTSKESSVAYLKHKIRMLQQRLRRREKKIKKMSNLLAEIKNKVF